jgi:hypothetical protein
MTMGGIDALISCQDALIAALDARDAAGIEKATADLAAAVQAVKAQDVWRTATGGREKVDHAIRQSDAARIRVNYMADWTRQRIDQLNELRRGAPAMTYGMPGK